MTRRLLLPLVLLGFVSASCSTFAVAAATVNGRKITEAQVESELDRVRADPTFQDLLQRQADEVRGTARRNILTGLIRQSVLELEARRRGIRVTTEQIDRLIEQEAQRQGMTIEQFRRGQNLSERDARIIGERIVRQFELRDRVTEDVAIGNDDVRAAYEAQKEAFVEVNLLRITVRTQSAARRVLEQVQDGQTFAQIAPKTSTDDLAEEGGDMGWVPLTTLPSQVQTALEAAAIGGVTDPVASAAGFEVYRLVDRRSRPFDDVAGELRGQLADQARERAFEEWLGRRLQAAKIVVNPKYGRFDPEAQQVVPGEQGLRP